MTDINKNIVELLRQNKSMKEISSIIGISEKQLYVRLKQIINYGYNLKPSYSYSSDIYYNIINGDPKQSNEITIGMPKANKVFKCLIYSDPHIGNKESDSKLFNYLYEYASKNDINYILCCGDIIEGDYTTDKKNIVNYEDQVDCFLKKYPYDKNINNVMIFGNHDHHAFKNNGFDILRKIKNSRYDLIPIGYGQGNVNVKGDSLVLFHKLGESSTPKIVKNEKIVLSGHGHMMKTKVRDQLWLCIPTLSRVSTDKTKEVVPGFIDLSIDFDKGKFDNVEAKHLILTPKPIIASESRCRLKNLN